MGVCKNFLLKIKMQNTPIEMAESATLKMY
jgi:hypothetical protein